MRRQVFGQIGKLKPDKIQEYIELHANAWPGGLETIHKCNLRNYSIFIQGDSVFAYYEYIGDDYDKDMAMMEEDRITQEWWKHTKPCFIKYAISPDREFYHDMQQIFYYE